MRPWRPKPRTTLGGGDTVLEEGVHFHHEMANKITIPGLRMEARAMIRRERLGRRGK